MYPICYVINAQSLPNNLWIISRNVYYFYFTSPRKFFTHWTLVVKNMWTNEINQKTLHHNNSKIVMQTLHAYDLMNKVQFMYYKILNILLLWQLLKKLNNNNEHIKKHIFLWQVFTLQIFFGRQCCRGQSWECWCKCWKSR